MDTKTLVFAIFFTGILSMGGLHESYGADLNAKINPNNDSSEFKITYYQTAKIRYDDGGKIADELRGNTWRIEVTASTPDPDVNELRNMLNQKILSDGSGTQIDDLTVRYTADMSGRSEYASVDYKIILDGTLANYNIAAETGIDGKKLVDMGWRGMSVFEPVYIGDVEINLPISALAAKEQAVYSYMRDLDVAKDINVPIINAEGLHDQKLPLWHYLFDPTGINVDASRYGISDEIKGVVISTFTLGESSVREGPKVETHYKEEFVIDEKYVLETFKFVDIGTIAVIGFALDDHLGELEILGVTTTAPAGQTATGDFPVIIIYGMAGIAAAGGGVFFVFSSRQLKKEHDVGQTGIDPSRLRGYQTSASSGGYQTNRGEAQLVDAADYEQTRSVYDDSEHQEKSSQVTPAPSEAACGCAASADSKNECDCQMQAQCFCDAACTCNASVCRDAVKDMQ